MKRIIIIFISNIVMGYKQHVHQYITIQAYNLLRYQLGYDFSVLQERLGGMDPYYVGSGPWQLGYLTTGTWREDEEDVVYGYSKEPPTYRQCRQLKADKNLAKNFDKQ